MAINAKDAALDAGVPPGRVYLDPVTGNLHVPSGAAIVRHAGSDEFYGTGIQMDGGSIQETVAVASLTDGGAAVGTYVMVGSIPDGAIVTAVRADQIVGFAGDTSCSCKVGDGTTVDRFCKSGGFSVFTTAADGVEAMGISGNPTNVSGAVIHPTLTFTSATDITLVVTDGHGSVRLTIYYRRTK